MGEYGLAERFLRYSLRHNKPVKAVLATGGGLRTGNITVLALSGGQVTYITARKKTPCVAAAADILSAGYARGDAGDTLLNERREEGSDFP